VNKPTHKGSSRPASSEVEAHDESAALHSDVQASLEAEVRARSLQLQVLSARLIANQDEERRRLARELHDSAGQYLSAILMQLAAALRDSDTVSRNAKISEAIEMAERCNSEIRTITYLLHPPLLDELGLRSAISMYVEGFSKRSGVQVDLQIPESLGRLPVSVETTLFRVVQQSLSNIYRHSGSTSARIEVDLDAENVTVNISDQGSGISAATLEEFNTGKSLLGVGVAGMRERIRDMKGRFDISSNKNGTTIHVSLPVS
jgi:signal transduction histidine kinase